MPIERILIEVMTSANLAGVEKADAGMLGLGANLASVTLLMGGLFEVGKKMVDISEEHAKAENNLSGAIADSGRVIRPTVESVRAYHKALADLAALKTGTYVPATKLTARELMNLDFAQRRVNMTTGQAHLDALRRLSVLQGEYAAKTHGAYTAVGNLAAAEARVAKARAAMGGTLKEAALNQFQVDAALEKFMQTNRDFISNQNDVINGWAALIREGVRFKDLTPLMTTALHIQAAEGGSLADAIIKVQQAEIGRNKSLTTAVGLILQAVKPTDTYAEKQKKIAANLKAVAAAYKDVKLTPLQIASDHLSTSWEKLAEKDGPKLAEATASVVNYLNDHMIPSFEHTAGVMDDTGAALDRLVANPNWDNFGALMAKLFGSGSDWANFLSGGRTGRLQAANAAALAAGSGTSIPHPNPHHPPKLTPAQTKHIKDTLRRHDRSQS